MKNKLKSKICNGKKKFKKMFFSVMTKNFNWEIPTKNLVTFKRWDRVNDKKFQYYGSSPKNPIFGGLGRGEGVASIFFVGGGVVNRLKRRDLSSLQI